MLMAHTATRHTVYALKRYTKRKRPNWQPGDTRDAFPSSHTAHVFSAAAFIHRRYGLEQAFIPYALASFTAYTRIHSKMHSWQDVAGGILIPSIYHFMFTKKYVPEAPSRKKGGGRSGETTEFFPHITPEGGFGLGFKIDF
jgi:membrane-associated phospholipid phosphatase